VYAYVLRLVGNGAFIIVGNRLAPRGVASPTQLHPSLLNVHVYRHTKPPDMQLICRYLNIQSLANKVDDLRDVRRDQFVVVLLPTETWYDDDAVVSVCLRRLRADRL
jgi:hypothetical protein